MSSTFRQHLACLALVATLLLALVPTLGRQFGDAPHHFAPTIVHDRGDAPHHADADGGRVPSRQRTADCEYCLIQADLLVPAVTAIDVALVFATVRLEAVVPSPRRDIHFGSLGSRGPPRLLRA